MTLFSRLGVAASWVLHILCINLFASRWCLMEGGCGWCRLEGGCGWPAGQVFWWLDRCVEVRGVAMLATREATEAEQHRRGSCARLELHTYLALGP